MRHTARSKKHQSPTEAQSHSKVTWEKTLKKKYDKAKLFVNVGEYSQAMTSLLSNGIAPITEIVLQQLRTKHPKRNYKIRWPSPPTISEHLENSSIIHSEPHVSGQKQPRTTEDDTGGLV